MTRTIVVTKQGIPGSNTAGYTPGGADVAVADGGTGASSAGTARTNLGAAAASDLTSHTGNTSNPHSVTKTQVGLGNVDDTSDENKPVSTAQQELFDRTIQMALVEDLAYPQIIAHRGGAKVYPEDTLPALKAAASEGFIPELDVQVLGDSRTLGVMHDTTVDRTSTSTGNVTAQSRRSWLQLQLDAGTWLGGGWPTLTAPLFEDVLNELGGKTVLMIESKGSSATGPLMVSQIVRRGLERSVIACATARPWLDPFIVAGITTALVGSTAVAPATLLADGVEWVMLDGSTDTHLTYVQSALAAGVKVAMYTLNNRYLTDRWLARGVQMVLSDDPAYVYGTSHRRTTDPFALQTWYPGLAPNLVARGSFTAPNWHTLPSTSNYFLAGYLCPLPNTAAWTLAFSVRLDVSSATSDWWALSICAEDDQASAANATGRNNAYALLYRRDGRMQIYRETRPNSAVLLAEVTGPTYAVGETLNMVAQVTSTNVTLSRADATGTVTVADTTRRGSYIFYGAIGGGGASSSWSSMVLT